MNFKKITKELVVAIEKLEDSSADMDFRKNEAEAIVDSLQEKIDNANTEADALGRILTAIKAQELVRLSIIERFE